MSKPINRMEMLQPLSREHHHGLLFCWKIRKGLIKKVDPGLIKRYADWFYRNHLLDHFETEEKSVFPVLGIENELAKQAVSEHRNLSQLFGETDSLESTLSAIADKLEDHIRFEERVLFNEIQQKATQKEIEDIEAFHGMVSHKTTEEWKDEFWK